MKPIRPTTTMICVLQTKKFLSRFSSTHSYSFEFFVKFLFFFLSSVITISLSQDLTTSFFFSSSSFEIDVRASSFLSTISISLSLPMNRTHNEHQTNVVFSIDLISNNLFQFKGKIALGTTCTKRSETRKISQLFIRLGR